MASSRSKKAQRNTILVRVICITLAALMILSVAAAALWRLTASFPIFSDCHAAVPSNGTAAFFNRCTPPSAGRPCKCWCAEFPV